jgi:hypothetical protein
MVGTVRFCLAIGVAALAFGILHLGSILLAESDGEARPAGRKGRPRPQIT